MINCFRFHPDTDRFDQNISITHPSYFFFRADEKAVHWSDVIFYLYDYGVNGDFG